MKHKQEMSSLNLNTSLAIKDQFALKSGHESSIHTFRTVLANASKATGLDLSKVPVIICDTGDSKSVLEMANQAKVVLNCVGPYRS